MRASVRTPFLFLSRLRLTLSRRRIVCNMDRVTASTLRRCLLRVGLAWLIASANLAAQEGAPEDGGRLKVRSLEIQGVSGLDQSQILEVLATRESGGMLPFLGKNRYFTPRQFQADLYRIVAFLSDNGWPKARVTSVDIDKDETKKAVDLTVHVDQGPPVIIDRVEMFGFDVLSP